MKKILFAGLFLGYWLTAASQSQCQRLDSGNQSPFAAIHLQPASLSSSQCQNSLSIQYSVSNSSFESQKNTETLLVDGEVSRLELRLQKQLSAPTWLDSISLSIPYYQHSGGFLDSAIDSWHGFTGLPESNRSQRPRDQLQYRYQRNGQTLVDIQKQQSGLGDTTIAAHMGRYNLAIQLPTGDEDRLTGSGGIELALSYSSALPEAGFNGFAGSLGASYIFDDKVLSEQHKQTTIAGAIMAAYSISNRVNLFISGSWQSAWYNSDIGALGDASGNIGIGAYGETANGFWSARITEDLPVETAPDFGISLDYSIKL